MKTLKTLIDTLFENATYMHLNAHYKPSQPPKPLLSRETCLKMSSASQYKTERHLYSAETDSNSASQMAKKRIKFVFSKVCELS